MISGYLATLWAPRVCVLVLACLVLWAPTPVRAEEAVDARTHALSLFRDSAVHYEEGRYSVAAALLEEAYALFPEPKLLYNLGRARESEGELDLAAAAYEAYLRAEPSSESER